METKAEVKKKLALKGKSPICSRIAAVHSARVRCPPLKLTYLLCVFSNPRKVAYCPSQVFAEDSSRSGRAASCLGIM